MMLRLSMGPGEKAAVTVPKTITTTTVHAK